MSSLFTQCINVGLLISKVSKVFSSSLFLVLLYFLLNVKNNLQNGGIVIIVLLIICNDERTLFFWVKISSKLPLSSAFHQFLLTYNQRNFFFQFDKLCVWGILPHKLIVLFGEPSSQGFVSRSRVWKSRIFTSGQGFCLVAILA